MDYLHKLTRLRFLLQLLQDLGLDLSQKKLQPLDIEMICLTILFNTKTRTISIPKKVDYMRPGIKKSDLFKTELHFLSCILKMCYPACAVLNRMLQFFRQHHEINVRNLTLAPILIGICIGFDCFDIL